MVDRLKELLDPHEAEEQLAFGQIFVPRKIEAGTEARSNPLNSQQPGATRSCRRNSRDQCFNQSCVKRVSPLRAIYEQPLGKVLTLDNEFLRHVIHPCLYTPRSAFNTAIIAVRSYA